MSVRAGDAEPDLVTLVRVARQPFPSETRITTPERRDTFAIPVTAERARRDQAVRQQVAAVSPTRAAPRRRRTTRRGASADSRALVVALVLSSLLCLGGFVYVGANPGWFFPPRQGIVASAGTAPVLAEHLVLLSTTTTAVTYQVPVMSYSLRVSCDHPCWIQVRSPAHSSAIAFARTLPASAVPFSIPLRGTSSISVAARVRVIRVMDGSKVLSTIASPVLSTAYTFVQRTS